MTVLFYPLLLNFLKSIEFGRFPGFARLSFLYENDTSEGVYRAVVE
jgi:hypothetical protein